jgi:peroxiredoxin
MKRSIFFVLVSILSLQGFCQASQGYNIQVSISGLKDSSIYLAYHFGDKQYLTDTVILDSRGTAQFRGNKSLPQGIYMIVLPGRKYFEILMTDDQQFSVTCLYNDFFNTLEFNGSDENAYFIKYQKKWIALQQEASTVAKRLQANKQNSDSLKILTQKQNILQGNMKAYLEKVISENKNNFLSVLVKSMIPADMPEFNVPAGTRNPDSVKWVLRYNYNTLHFFDNVDLTDERLLRTPILYSRFEAYFKGDPIQAADSINRKVDIVLNKCKSNHDVFQYAAVYLFNHFRESEIMGHDAVMLKLADDVYLSGKADWVSEDFKENLRKQVEFLRNNLIGMKAKDIVMNTYRGNTMSLYDIEKDFTILYFWEPNCGHCKEATPKLKTFYDKQRDYTIEIFAVCTTDEKDLWSKYIEDNKLTWINGWDPERLTHYDFYYNVQSTPIVYILDRNKKIIAKKLAVEDIEGYIDNYRRFFR